MIRAATGNDLPAINEMFREFWSHSAYKVPFKDGSPDVYARLALDCGLLFIAERDGEVIGFSAGALASLMGNDDYVMGTELGWWVNPECRGGREGIQLLDALESGARDAGCTFWHMIFMESSMPETIKGIYERRGYTLHETTYCKRLQ